MMKESNHHLKFKQDKKKCSSSHSDNDDEEEECADHTVLEMQILIEKIWNVWKWKNVWKLNRQCTHLTNVCKLNPQDSIDLL